MTCGRRALACLAAFLLGVLVVVGAVPCAPVAHGAAAWAAYPAYSHDAPSASTTTASNSRIDVASGEPQAAVTPPPSRSQVSRRLATKAGSGAARAAPTGLQNASTGLRGAFDGGSIRDRSILGVRSALTENGFARQQLTKNRGGYRFDGPGGEQVRIMRRGGGWDVRVQNRYGNYLDEFGNVASPQGTHGITLRSR